MKIFYDENMPYADSFFSEFGELVPFAGREIKAEQVADADVLLVRSITQVNDKLLNQAKKLTFVGTATIGVDHIDESLLASKSIGFSSAPGCNAVSVAEYVISALSVLSDRYQFSMLEKTVGIVGAGNTGTRLSEKLAACGINYKICDPILAQQGDSREFSSLEEVLACDVISLHVPKTKEGKHATFHLLNQERLAQLTEDQVLINACRGEVIDNQALLALKQAGHGLTIVLDVWEGEPNILMPLLPFCDLASAHIAGYSLEGKARGTEMLYQALCQHLGKTPNKSLEDFLPEADLSQVVVQRKYDEKLLKQLVKMVYDVRRDDDIFRQQIEEFGFDHIRKTYPARREFSSLSVKTNKDSTDSPIYQLGFIN